MRVRSILLVAALPLVFGCPMPGAPGEPDSTTTTTSTTTSTTLGCGGFITAWGGTGTGNGKFGLPWGVATGAGNVFVVDYGASHDRIQKFDGNGTFLLAWGSTGSVQGQLKNPAGVAVDAAGHVFVADTDNDRIEKFDGGTGTFLAAWGTTGTANGQFSAPSGLAVDAAGNVYVADTLNTRIQKFDNDGTFVAKWATAAAAYAVAVGPKGDVFAVDGNSGTERIEKFDNAGKLFATWASSGNGNGQLNLPRGIAVDPGGNVFVADSGNSRVQVFDPDGQFLVAWGTFGSGDGQFELPRGVATDSSGHVFVTSDARVQKFGCAFAPTVWPRFHHDRSQTGLSPADTRTNAGVQRWKFTTAASVSSSPAIAADGTVYVGSDDGNLYALKPDGSMRWSVPTGGAVFSSPAIGPDGTIYVGSANKALYAIDPAGTQKWKFGTTVSVDSSPAVGADGTIYTGSQDGTLYAVTPAGGQKWQLVLTGALSSPAVGADGTIYVGSVNRTFHAVNPDGTQKWAFSASDAVQSSPAIASDGTIYVGSNDRELFALTPSGTQKWVLSIGDSVPSSPAIGPDGTIYVSSEGLHAVTPLGSEKWVFGPTIDFRRSSPAVGADGTIYVGANDDGLYAVNPDGTQRWKVPTAGAIVSSPAIGADGTVYVGSSDYSLYAVGAPLCTASPGPCCGPERMTLLSSTGTIHVDNLAPWPLPAGVITTIDSGPAGGLAGECRHPTVIPAGGLRVPNYDIPPLNYCGAVIDRHCEAGSGEGAGFLWDGHGVAGLALTDVSTRADTSDGVCGLLGAGCTTTAGGAGVDTLGDVDRTFAATAGCGVRTASDVAVRMLVWSDGGCAPATTPGCCATATYGDDTPANGELLITAFDSVLSITTNRADAAFADKNHDGCARAGSGFGSPLPNGPKVRTGAPPAGPCCTAGQPATLVAVSVGFTGSAPLYDIGYEVTMPTTVSSCGAAGSDTCTVTSNPCFE